MDVSGTSTYVEDEIREDVVDYIAAMGSSSAKWSSGGRWCTTKLDVVEDDGEVLSVTTLLGDKYETVMVEREIKLDLAEEFWATKDKEET
ncbi:hypothetical protein SESBI_22102 [Sesbania bispinosa]|nr:hypothetical protein SESBI_22102 [Sesbania bispinosa]